MTRFNRSVNPSAATTVSNWRGSVSISRVTGLSGPPRSTGGSVSMGTAAFSQGIGCGIATGSGVAPGVTWSGVVWVRAAVARRVALSLITWSGTTFVPAGSPTAVEQDLVANTWTEMRITAALLSATFDGVNLHIDIPTSGLAGTLTLSSCRLEPVSDPGISYADGDTSGWSWSGTAGNSVSSGPDARGAGFLPLLLG